MKSLNDMLPSFSSRFVYLIGDEGAVLIYLENGSVIRRLFAPDCKPEHTESFTDLLKAHPKARIDVLIDMMDQSYVRHALPPVSSLGLGKLVQRRLDRDFSKDDIKGALNQGREDGGRKDWSFLLISLSHSDQLKAWLQLVVDLPNRFGGIYLLPVECELLIRELDVAMAKHNRSLTSSGPQLIGAFTPETHSAEEAEKKKKSFSLAQLTKKKDAADSTAHAKPEWQMLVSHNKVGGFRQVVLRKGKLIFTRLTQAMNDSQPEVLAGSVEQEVLNTIEYLKRLSYNPRAGLDIYIIVAQEIKSSISTARFGATNAHVLTPFEASEALRLKQAALSGDRFGDVILATAFGVAKRHRLKFNSDYSRRVSTMENAHLAARAAAAASILGLLASNGSSLLAMQGLYAENQNIADETAHKEKQFAALTKTVEALPFDVDEIADMIYLTDLLSQKDYTLLHLVQDLGNVIDDNALVTSLDWKYGSNVFIPRTAPAPGSGTAGAEGNELTVSINLELIYKEDNWDAFLERFNVLMDKFKHAFPDYQVSSNTLPGTFTPQDNLKVDFENLESQRAGPAAGQTFPVTITITGPAKQNETSPQAPSPEMGDLAPKFEGFSLLPHQERRLS